MYEGISFFSSLWQPPPRLGLSSRHKPARTPVSWLRFTLKREGLRCFIETNESDGSGSV